jgi:hypothetical protein
VPLGDGVGEPSVGVEEQGAGGGLAVVGEGDPGRAVIDRRFAQIPRPGDQDYGFAVGLYPTDAPTLPDAGARPDRLTRPSARAGTAAPASARSHLAALLAAQIARVICAAAPVVVWLTDA